MAEGVVVTLWFPTDVSVGIHHHYLRDGKPFWAAYAHLDTGTEFDRAFQCINDDPQVAIDAVVGSVTSAQEQIAELHKRLDEIAGRAL